MIDDFDFEDDLGDLKATENDNSFFPPVNNTGSRLSLNGNRPVAGSIQVPNSLPKPIHNPVAQNNFPKASGNLGFGEKSDNDSDDFGLDEVAPKQPAKVNAIKPINQRQPIPQNNLPTLSKPQGSKFEAKRQSKEEEDYDLNDFDFDDDSPQKKPEPKAAAPLKQPEAAKPFPSPGFSKDVEDKI